MDLGKYKKARRAMTRKQGGLRIVVFDPNITDTDVDFPDIEQPKMGFEDGGIVQREGFAESKSPYGTRFTEDLKKKVVELAKQGKSPEAIMNLPEFEGINNARTKIIAVINQSPKVPKKYKFIADARGQGFTFGQFDKIKKDVVSDFNKQDIKNIAEIGRDRFPQMRAEAANREVRRILQEAGARDIPKPIEAKQEPKTQQQIERDVRKEKLKILSDPSLERSLTGNLKDQIEFHHADSKNLNSKIFTTANRTGYIDKKTNKDLRTGDALIDKFYEDRARLLKNKPKGGQALKNWNKKWEEINVKGMNTVANPKYQGLLNFKVIDPVTFEVRDTGLDEGKMLMRTPDPDIPGLYGQDDELATKPFKQMTVEEKRKIKTIADKKYKDLKKLKPQDAINAIGSLGCPTNYADGGKVKFAQGSNCYAKGLQVIEAAKAGDTSALGKIKKFFKSPAGKVLGGVGAELAFETMFVLPDYAAGKPFDEILGATTFGLFGAGTSPDESLYKYSGNDPKVKEYQEIKKVEDQLMEDIEKFKAYQQDPGRFRNIPQSVLKKSMGELITRINDNSKIYQQKKSILDPKGEYAQAMEQAKQIQQADYKKNIEESQGRQLVGKAGEKMMEGAKGVGSYIGKAYEYLKEKINPDMEGLDVTDEIVDEAALFASGGRVGFSEGGPGKMGRRGFLKLLGGIAALIGAAKSGLKFETKTAKQIIKNAPQGTPEWFAPLVEKIAKEGIDMSENLATQERQIVKELKVKNKYGTAYDDTYTLYENPDTGEIAVDVDALGVGANEGPVTFHLRPKKTDVDPETGQQLVDEGEFIIEEDRAVGRLVSPDGDYDMDLEPTFVGMDDTASDIYGIEEFATGTTNKAKQREQLLKKDYVEKNPGEDISNRYGEYDPPEPDYD